MEEWKPMTEAAELLGVHRNTLWRLAKAKRIVTRTRQVEGCNMLQRLVEVGAVRKLIGTGPLKPGPRPKPKRAISGRRTPVGTPVV